MESRRSLFGGQLEAPDFDEFVALCADPLGDIEIKHADRIDRGVPIYHGDALREAAAEPATAEAVRAELAVVLGDGPGVIAIAQAWNDPGVLDAMSATLLAILERERDQGDGFDHFAASGANSRAWDTLGKAAKLNPAAYVEYYSNPVLDLVCTAWLGPWYQPTAQVNVVHPGGSAQSPHRDYHLGFLTDADAARFPAHVHRLSPALTLQGAVAHTTMPIESGPTMLLPGSQRFTAGYLAWRDPRFAEHFARHQVQLPLEAGDAVFFNPALFHGAGTNRTSDHDRMANLLQISSAFGIAMEAIDWPGIACATYPTLLERHRAGTLTDAHIAVCASGYAFPSNLDTDTSHAGLAPPSMQQLLRDALERELDPADFAARLAAKQQARLPY